MRLLNKIAEKEVTFLDVTDFFHSAIRKSIYRMFKNRFAITTFNNFSWILQILFKHNIA